MPSHLISILSIFVNLLVLSRQSDVPTMVKYYCVIGAGPSGLQMAQFLQQAQRDYVVFEMNEEAGSFFKKYPRHRKLISTNQKDTGSTNKEYNLRHDLNSLLADQDGLRFTDYTDDFVPSADDLVKYLGDFRKKSNLAIQFDTQISVLRYHEDARNDFCRFTMKDQKQNLYCCKNVFLATGWSQPKHPRNIGGIELVDTYDSMPIDQEAYRDRSILIIGRGISGFETALALEPYAKSIHMASSNGMKLYWNLARLGEIRKAKDELLLQKLLQNSDSFFELDVGTVEFARGKSNKIKVLTKDETPQNLRLDGYDRIILCLGFEWDTSIFHRSMHPESYEEAGIPRGVYPDMGADFQSKDYPGLYFIGPLMHALDFGRSAGGFIHGFRSTERALHRMIEWRNHGVRWPSVTQSIDRLVSTMLKRANEASGIFHMFSFLADLAIVERSTKKFTYLEEYPILLLPTILKDSGYEFNPEKHSLFVLAFQYGTDLNRKGVDMLKGSRTGEEFSKNKEDLQIELHPVVYFYDGTLPTADELASMNAEDVLPRPTAIHHILEEQTKTLDGRAAHIALLRRFVEHYVREDLRSPSAEECMRDALTRRIGSEEDGCKKQLGKMDSVLVYH